MSKQKIYLISSRFGLMKIGISADPPRRLADLQRASGDVMALLKEWPLPDGKHFKIERAVHATLSACRKNGEWFNCSADEAITAIESALESPPEPKIVTPRAPSIGATGALTIINVKGVQEDAWALAKQEAARRGMTLGNFLSTAIVGYLKTPPVADSLPNHPVPISIPNGSKGFQVTFEVKLLESASGS